MKKLSSLRYTSAFALCAVLYLIVVVLKFFIFPMGAIDIPTVTDIVWIKFDSSTLSHLPIFVFAFTCHQVLFI